MSTFDDTTVLPEDHSFVVKAAANLLAQFASRMINPPRLPTSHERHVLDGLQKDLTTPFCPVIHNIRDDKENLDLLRRLWSAVFGPAVPFERVSEKWRSIGFQQNDPTSDIRGGGRLSLEALVYLIERHTSVARRMILKRSTRVRARGEFANFPFACAGITLTKRLCEAILISQPLTGKPSRAFEHTPTTFYHVAGSRVAFFELFVWAFVSLDALWDDTNSSYLDFGRVMTLCVHRITNVLHRLPADVVPSARSHAVEETFGYESTEPSFLLDGLHVDDLGGHSEQEEEKTSKVSDSRTPMSPKACSGPHLDVTEDLLGLSQFEGDCSSLSDLSLSKGLCTTTKRQLPDVDFFGEFGLTS